MKAERGRRLATVTQQAGVAVGTRTKVLASARMSSPHVTLFPRDRASAGRKRRGFWGEGRRSAVPSLQPRGFWLVVSMSARGRGAGSHAKGRCQGRYNVCKGRLGNRSLLSRARPFRLGLRIPELARRLTRIHRDTFLADLR